MEDYYNIQIYFSHFLVLLLVTYSTFPTCNIYIYIYIYIGRYIGFKKLFPKFRENMRIYFYVLKRLDASDYVLITKVFS